MDAFGNSFDRPHAASSFRGPKKQTTDPYVTEASVLAIKYADGVMLAADTLASYGSLARFRDIQRLTPVGKFTIVAASGEYSDYQEITRLLDELITSDEIQDDGHRFTPKAIHRYMSQVMYNRRNKNDPFWNQLVVAGFRDGQSFLGLTDLHGTSYEDESIATGYGSHLAKPMLRKAPTNLSYEGAKKLLETCLRVLFYRDARTINRVQIATITALGAQVSDPYELSTDWETSGTIIYKDGVRNTIYNKSDKMEM